MYLSLIGVFFSIICGINCESTDVKPGVDINDLTKIVNGYLAYIDDFPSTVSFQVNMLHNCGGLLIRFDWVLTAGHCTYSGTTKADYNIRALSIVAGMTMVDDDDTLRPEASLNPPPDMNPTIAGKNRAAEPRRAGNDNRRAIAVIYRHPAENRRTLVNDIPLLKLTTPFKLSTKIRVPTKWPDASLMASRMVPRTPCEVAGWGLKTSPPRTGRSVNGVAKNDESVTENIGGISRPTTKEDGITKDEPAHDTAANGTQQNDPAIRKKRQTLIKVMLGFAKVRLAEMLHCTQSNVIKFYKTDIRSQVCTVEVGPAVCAGDSGGPLYCNGYPIGILSYGLDECGIASGYGVYTRVDTNLQWVSSVIAAATPRPRETATLQPQAGAATQAAGTASFVHLVAFCSLVVFTLRIYY